MCNRIVRFQFHRSFKTMQCLLGSTLLVQRLGQIVVRFRAIWCQLKCTAVAGYRLLEFALSVECCTQDRVCIIIAWFQLNRSLASGNCLFQFPLLFPHTGEADVSGYIIGFDLQSTLKANRRFL